MSDGPVVDASDAYTSPPPQPDRWVAWLRYPISVTVTRPGASMRFTSAPLSDRRVRRRREAALRVPITLAALAAFALTASASTGQESAPAPERMVLTAADLPAGFVVVRRGTGPWTNADVIRERGNRAGRELRRWGRITGYRATYRQRDPAGGALPGVIEFDAAVALFRTAAGAHSALTRGSAGCRTKGWTRIPLAGNRPVGPDTQVCTRGFHSRGMRFRVFAVQWRNGRATGGVAVLHVEGAVTAHAALRGGYEQNRRMGAELARR